MSNVVCLDAVTFDRHVNGKTTFGYVVYDNYVRIYSDGFEAVPSDDLELLRLILTERYSLSGLGEIFAYIEETLCGVFINGTRYSWEDIKEILLVDAQT